MGLINIGFTATEKEEMIRQYQKEHPDVENIIIFYPDGWEHLGIDAEYTPYSEIIMYRTFYPYLQKIDKSYLLVYDECMRTKNRYDLTYNCAHKYNNQTPHVMVFEGFPFIDEPDDFMILADLVDSVRMRARKHFDPSVLDEIDTEVKHNIYDFGRIDVDLPAKAEEAYFNEKDKLFANLGNKDPDTLPNALEIFVGKWKKPKENLEAYVARNQRFKTDTFAMHKKTDEAKLIDLPLAQKDFNDWLKLSGCKSMLFLHTGLKVDIYFYNRYCNWFKEVEKFYETASLYERICA